MAEPALSMHKPDTITEFSKKAEYNLKQITHFNREAKKCQIKILAEDSRFETSVPSNSVDIIVTSPLMVTARTTVAYGQFSRLSSEWLNFDKKIVRNVDKISLGGIPTAI